MMEEGKESGRLLARAAAGDAGAWGILLTAHEERLRRVVAFRLDPRLRGRVDAADVVQEVDVDTRSDVYSLGVLLYELLTGRRRSTGGGWPRRPTTGCGGSSGRKSRRGRARG